MSAQRDRLRGAVHAAEARLTLAAGALEAIEADPDVDGRTRSKAEAAHARALGRLNVARQNLAAYEATQVSPRHGTITTPTRRDLDG